MLKLPLMFDDLTDVRALFVTCCVLHNMLLQVDSDNYDEASPHSESIIGNTMCAPFVLLAVVVVVFALMILLLQTVMMIVMMMIGISYSSAAPAEISAVLVAVQIFKLLNISTLQA